MRTFRWAVIGLVMVTLGGAGAGVPGAAVTEQNVADIDPVAGAPDAFVRAQR